MEIQAQHIIQKILVLGHIARESCGRLPKPILAQKKRILPLLYDKTGDPPVTDPLRSIVMPQLRVEEG